MPVNYSGPRTQAWVPSSTSYLRFILHFTILCTLAPPLTASVLCCVSRCQPPRRPLPAALPTRACALVSRDPATGPGLAIRYFFFFLLETRPSPSQLGIDGNHIPGGEGVESGVWGGGGRTPGELSGLTCSARCIICGSPSARPTTNLDTCLARCTETLDSPVTRPRFIARLSAARRRNLE